MKELLEKWSQLEPELCHESSDDPGWFFIGRQHDDFLHFVSVDGSFEESVYLSEIQGAVQQAIEAKGWDYEQRCWGGKGKIAYVYPPTVEKLIRHDCSTHAEALLRAYLEALELTGGAENGE